MIFNEALEHLKRGGKIARGGKTFLLGFGIARGLHATQNSETERAYFSDEDRAADDWEIAVEPAAPEAIAEPAPEVIAPEAVDEVLSEAGPNP